MREMRSGAVRALAVLVLAGCAQDRTTGDPPEVDAGAGDAALGRDGASGGDGAAADAGPADAGGADAGGADAGGADARVADAAVIDAARADAGGADAGRADAGGVDARVGDATVADAAAPCPPDVFAAIGAPCPDEGRFCGGEQCGDPCSFCNVIRCEGGAWRRVEVPPGPPDECRRDAGPPEGCDVTARVLDEGGATLAERRCRVADPARTCNDVARCLCEAFAAADPQVAREHCETALVMPRALINLSDLCAAADRTLGAVVRDPAWRLSAPFGPFEVEATAACDDVAARIDFGDAP